MARLLTRPALLALLALFTLGVASPASAAQRIDYTYGWTWATNHLTVSDATGAAWPVSTGTAEWDKGATLALTYTRAPCPAASTSCVSVHEVASIDCPGCGPFAYIAGTAEWWQVGGVTTHCDVTLSNQTYSGVRLHAVVHELGHCFGLGHPPVGTDSVMAYGNTDTAPTPLDWWNLRRAWR